STKRRVAHSCRKSCDPRERPSSHRRTIFQSAQCRQQSAHGCEPGIDTPRLRVLSPSQQALRLGFPLMTWECLRVLWVRLRTTESTLDIRLVFHSTSREFADVQYAERRYGEVRVTFRDGVVARIP